MWTGMASSWLRAGRHSSVLGKTKPFCSADLLPDGNRDGKNNIPEFLSPCNPCDPQRPGRPGHGLDLAAGPCPVPASRARSCCGEAAEECRGRARGLRV